MGSEKQEGAGVHGELCSVTEEELSDADSKGLNKDLLPFFSDLFHYKIVGNL